MVKKEVYIIKRMKDSTIYYRSEDGQLISEVANDSAISILELCNGKRSHDKIISILCNKYNEQKETVTELVKEFIEECNQKKYIVMNNTMTKTPRRGFCKGDYNKVIPNQIFIETTYNCPLFCKHCLNVSVKYSPHRTSTRTMR